MNRNPVNSSNIKSVGYDDLQETLEVEFKSGAVWQYFPIKEKMYKALIGAHSVGSYFLTNIRGKFTEKRIR